MSIFLAALILAVSPETLQEAAVWPSDPHNGPWLDPDG